MSLKADLDELNKPPTTEQIDGALELLIKEDMPNAKLTFYSHASALTTTPFNLIMVGETSTGKSHLLTSVKTLFPKEEHLAERDKFISTKGFASATSFYHEVGTYDKDRKEEVIEAFPRVFVFLDQPDKHLLERMKPILSHDEKEIVFSYTDQNKNAKTVRIRGTPAVIYSTTDLQMTDELANRGWLVTPTISQKKWTAAVSLVAHKEKDLPAFQKEVDANADVKKIRQWMIKLVEGARTYKTPYDVTLHDRKKIVERFTKIVGGKLQARSARDLSRIFSLVKTIAMVRGRQKTNDEDVEEAFQVIAGIVGSNLKGIPPIVQDFYDNVISPIAANGNLEKAQIREQYKTFYNETLTSKRYDQYIEALNHHGLIELVPNPEHKGWRLIKPMYSVESSKETTPSKEDKKTEQSKIDANIGMEARGNEATTANPPKESYAS